MARVPQVACGCEGALGERRHPQHRSRYVVEADDPLEPPAAGPERALRASFIDPATACACWSAQHSGGPVGPQPLFGSKGQVDNWSWRLGSCSVLREAPLPQEMRLEPDFRYRSG